MVEDQKTPFELYERLFTELLFGVRKWLEYDYLKFSKNFESPELANQLTTRLFRQKGERVQIESKKEYKSRGNSSPDHADSLSLLVYLARERLDEIQTIFATTEHMLTERLKPGLVDNEASQYLDFSNNELPRDATQRRDMFFSSSDIFSGGMHEF
jgi:hypothetical protein